MTRRQRMLADLEQDIRDHLDRETQDNIDRGMSPEDARTAAMRKFGNVARIKEKTWEVWSILWLEQFLQDIRFGIRTLLRSPGLTIAAILAIALGIGINVGIFSVLNGLALRSLPVPRSRELLAVNQVFHYQGRGNRAIHNDGTWFSYPEYLDYRDHNQVFSGLVAYEPYVDATLRDGDVRPVLGTVASCNYFDVLLEHPAHGRGFIASDCAASESSAVVVVSDDLWRSKFASDPSLIGKKIVLNQTAYTVIGIARPGFTGTEPIPSVFWVPITMQPALEPGMDRLNEDNMSWLALLGRTRAGESLPGVRADLDVIAARIDRRHPGRTTSLAIRSATFFSSPEERSFVIPAASVVLAAFALVLLIACANVANLLLARASVRQKEIALRLSMGAGRWRLIRQLLTESLLLSLAGGALGSILAFWSFIRITALVASHLPSDFPPFAVNVAPNLRCSPTHSCSLSSPESSSVSSLHCAARALTSTASSKAMAHCSAPAERAAASSLTPSSSSASSELEVPEISWVWWRSGRRHASRGTAPSTRCGPTTPTSTRSVPVWAPGDRTSRMVTNELRGRAHRRGPLRRRPRRVHSGCSAAGPGSSRSGSTTTPGSPPSW